VIGNFLRWPVFLPDGTAGELASVRWDGDVVIAVRVQVRRHLTDWLDPATLWTRTAPIDAEPQAPARQA